MRRRFSGALLVAAACLAVAATGSCAGHSAPSAPTASTLSLSIALSVSNVKFGTAVPGDFMITVTQPARQMTAQETEDGPVLMGVTAGDAYSVSVAGPAGYSTTMSADCAGTATVGRKSCAIDLKELPLTCDDSLWNRIYLRNRLRLLSQCQTAAGTVVDLGVEPDGDLVMEVVPDAPYTSLLRPGNSSPDAHGHLVVEVPCQGVTTLDSPRTACAQFTGARVDIPKLGAHIAIAAPWVEDLNHSAWGELHGARLVPLPR